MSSSHPPSARGDGHAQPSRPRRLWDVQRQCWIEPQTVCRDTLGRYARKLGTEPKSQLIIPFEGMNAA